MNDEDVVILQEVPHKRLIDKIIVPWTWEEQSMFQRFVDTFDKEYKIFYPRFLIDSNQCTIGLGSKETRWKASQKHIIKYNRFHHYGNKLIEIEKDNNFNFENGISIEVKKTDRFISDHGCCFLNIQNP